MADWTDERVEQLLAFNLLLNECATLNTGNNIISRLRRILGLVEELQGFNEFLRNDCIATRQAAKEATNDEN